MIVKNESANLARCLGSLDGLVDEVVVYDTGSTDDTVAIARAHGARVLEGYWDDDFARARNESLAAVRAEWFVWVDGDDEVSGLAGPAVRAYLAGDTSALPGAPPARAIDLIQLRILNVSASDREMHALESVRVARRDRVRWHGRIHEQLELTGPPRPGIGALRLAPELLHIRHHGYADPTLLLAKSHRNVQIAQAQVDDLVDRGSPDPHEAARAGYDLARSLLAAGRTQEAVEAFEVVRDIAADGLYRAQATLMLAQTLLDQGGFDDAGLHLAEELARDGLTSPQFCDWLRAQALARTGRREEALALLRTVTELVDPAGNRQSLERVLVARALFAGAEGHFEESAETMLELVLTYGPRADRCGLLLRLWSRRLEELTVRLARDLGPFREDTLRLLDGLGEPGPQVAAAAREELAAHAPAAGHDPVAESATAGAGSAVEASVRATETGPGRMRPTPTA